jgi:predicted metalloenzyme YecM
VCTAVSTCNSGEYISTRAATTTDLVCTANTLATAGAGADQNVASAASVTLDGSGSEANDESQSLTYVWTQTSDTDVSLSSLTAEGPTFTAPTLAIGDADVVLEFSLVVNDGIASSVADAISVTVAAPANTPATAGAGADQNVASAASVTLDGSGIDAKDVSQSLTYVWTQTSDTDVSLSSLTTEGPTFTAPTLAIGDADVVLEFSLVVDDGIASSVADTISVTVAAPANTPATAGAGADQNVASAASVTLDGSGSDANDVSQSLTYVWTQTSDTDVSLSSLTAEGPTFTAPTLAIGDADVVLEFSLVVDDGIASSVADTISVTVAAPANTPATAGAGADQNVASAASVTLDGSGSDANDVSQSLTYVWTQTSGTDVSLSSLTAEGPTFTAPTLAIGDADVVLEFSLVVNDGIASSVADIVSITVSDVTPPEVATGITITTNPNGSITVAGMAEPGATVQVTFPDGTVSTFIAPKPSELIKARFSRNKQSTILVRLN